MEKIDFVVTWVDGNDPNWREERAQYMPDREDSGNNVNRYRDWGLMKYWFRGVEKYAPWVNKVFFVTCGHYPEWLNMDHPKLVCVKHSDYIPQKVLPTYNSNVIELYMHQISELSEHFVLFNDDVFLTDHVEKTDFFQNGLPCDTACLGEIYATTPHAPFPHCLVNNASVINKYFVKHDVMRRHWRKLYSLKYGGDVIRNILLTPFVRFSTFRDTHLAASHLKSVFAELWEKEPDLLERCCRNRFRSYEDVSHWMMKSWYICQGNFSPRSNKWGKCFELRNNPNVFKEITGQQYKMICFNDSATEDSFEPLQREMIKGFEKILPKKSSFEK